MKKYGYRLITCLLVLSMSLSFAACGKTENRNKNGYTEASCYQLALAMAASEEENGELAVTVYGDRNFDMRLQSFYEMEEEITDGCIIYSTTERSTEFAVLKLKNKEDTDAAVSSLEEYINDRIGAYIGYFPEEADVLQNSYTFAKKQYVVLDISRMPETAQEAFERIFGYDQKQLLQYEEECEELAQTLEENESRISQNAGAEEDTGKPDANENAEGENITDESQLHDRDDSTYFNQDIATAYLNGTPEILTDEKDIAVYDRIVEILSEIITEDMTELEKEKAVHDYMCMYMEYDRKALNYPEAQMPDSDNPYGMLVDGYGICSGYASTFLLFMDCLEIDCIVVEGMAYNLTEPHAWNKVKLSGEWYCVDVTWDDPVYDEELAMEAGQWYPEYTYFNCSDEDLANAFHQWNKTEYPESPYTMEGNWY